MLPHEDINVRHLESPNNEDAEALHVVALSYVALCQNHDMWTFWICGNNLVIPRYIYILLFKHVSILTDCVSQETTRNHL